MAVNQPLFVRELVIASEISEGSWVQEEIIAHLEARQFSPHDVFGVRLALEEALVNAIKHGNQFDSSKQVRIICSIDGARVQIDIEDEGRGFNPDDVPDPTLPENLERPTGRGILLMRSYMTSVTYNERGNRVTLEKHLSLSESLPKAQE